MHKPTYTLGYIFVAFGAINAIMFATTLFGVLYGVVFIGIGLAFALHGRTAE
jgi:hypothetical protein